MNKDCILRLLFCHLKNNEKTLTPGQHDCNLFINGHSITLVGLDMASTGIIWRGPVIPDDLERIGVCICLPDINYCGFIV